MLSQGMLVKFFAHKEAWLKAEAGQSLRQLMQIVPHKRLPDPAMQ